MIETILHIYFINFIKLYKLSQTICYIFNMIKKFFQQFDLFSALPTLRARGETQTMNICGGIVSFLLFGLFVFMFIESFISTIQLKSMKVIQRQEEISGGSQRISGFFFAVGISATNYFRDIYPVARLSMYKNYQTRLVTGELQITKRLIGLQECRLDHFSNLGDKAQDAFVRFALKDKLCPSNFSQLQIQNQTANQFSLFLSIELQRCTWQPNCNQHSQAILRYSDYQNRQIYKASEIVLFLIDNLIDPSKQYPVQKKISFIRSLYSYSLGQQTVIFLKKFQVVTDFSITPFPNVVEEEGYLFSRQTKFMYESKSPHPYMMFVIQLQPSLKVIDRTVGKFDELLSFVGGLFSIVFSLVAFFMLSYNIYRYEIMVGEGAFNYNDDGKKLKQEEFHFLKYIKYSIYDWIELLCCCELDWQDCKEIRGTCEEATNTLDVGLLFKKLHHHQRCIQYLIPSKQQISLYLTEPPSLAETTRKRKLAQYYDKVIKFKSAMTIEDVKVKDDVENILHLGLSMTKLDVQFPKSTNSRFRDLVDINRENIIDYAFKQHPEEMQTKEESYQFDEYDLQLEKQLAEAFYSLKVQNRLKIQEKIPIKILHRLSERIKQSQEFQIKLQ